MDSCRTHPPTQPRRPPAGTGPASSLRMVDAAARVGADDADGSDHIVGGRTAVQRLVRG